MLFLAGSAAACGVTLALTAVKAEQIWEYHITKALHAETAAPIVNQLHLRQLLSMSSAATCWAPVWRSPRQLSRASLPRLTAQLFHQGFVSVLQLLHRPSEMCRRYTQLHALQVACTIAVRSLTRSCVCCKACFICVTCREGNAKSHARLRCAKTGHQSESLTQTLSAKLSLP